MTAHRPAARRRITEPHRHLRLVGTLAGITMQSVLTGPGRASRRSRAQLCGAARLLTAAGVRVRVVAPSAAWPRAGGRIVVSGSVGRLDELAVLTAVPRTVTGWTQLAERALLGHAVTPPAVAADDVLLPIAVRYRYEGADCWLGEEEVPRTLHAALARSGLVVEVRLLPALRSSSG